MYVSLNSNDCSIHQVKQVVINLGVKCVDAYMWERIYLTEFTS